MHGVMQKFHKERVTNADWWTSVTNANCNQILLEVIPLFKDYGCTNKNTNKLKTLIS